MISHRLARLCAPVLGVALALVGCSGHGEAVPYKDTNANGVIGLCSKAGTPINHGKVNDSPFVWRSVSSSAAKPPYDAYRRTATLYAYVPKPGYPPQDWLGEQISAAAYYSNPAHPMVQATSGDGAALLDFVQGSPPRWNGLIELRIYLGVPGESIYNATYPATDIQVKGDTWTVVRGGDVACDSGSAVSSLVGTPPPPSPAPTTTATSR
ncbi:MAG: hypothetical protein QOD49_2555 [Actinomycetota bacterium]|nr:hypothetical protein [Actinomycetota bacterium]